MRRRNGRRRTRRRSEEEEEEERRGKGREILAGDKKICRNRKVMLIF